MYKANRRKAILKTNLKKIKKERILSYKKFRKYIGLDLINNLLGNL